MTATVVETVLKLLPLAEPAVSAEKPDHDAWLTQSNVSLVHDLYSQQPNSPHMPAQNRVHTCAQLSVRATAQGYELETPQGAVILADSDIIALPQAKFLVLLEREHVEQPEIVQPKSIPLMPEIEDIWSNGEQITARPQFADPFAHQAVVAAASTPAVPYTVPTYVAQPVVSQDPLGFLYQAQQSAAPYPGFYPQQPTYFAAPQPMPEPMSQPAAAFVVAQPQAPQGNVLHDLNINPQQSTISEKQFTAGKPTYLEQSPMDMLDEYLAPDMVMPIANHAAAMTPAPSYHYAPNIHDDEVKPNFLGAMKQIFSRKPQSTPRGN